MGLFGRVSAATTAWIAGAAAAVTPPILVLGFDQPAWLALGAAVLAFAAPWPLLWRGGGDRAGVQLDGTRAATARAVLAEGQAALEELRQHMRGIRDQMMREEIKLLTLTAERVIREAREDPACVMQVRRLFTFYLPNAASVAEGWRALESKHEPAPLLVTQTRETMASLNEAFSRFADEMHEPKLQTLDLDLKVLDNALKADLERS